MHLRPRLTSIAVEELSRLLPLLYQVQLTGDMDDQRITTTSGAFRTKDVYEMLRPPSQTDENAPVIWGTRVPNKVKIFAWLFCRNRLSTKANLLRKCVVSESVCSRCGAPSEDRRHVFLECPVSKRIWDSLHVAPSLDAAESIWSSSVPAHLDKNLWPDVLCAILWRMWEARNNDVLRGESSDARIILTKTREDLDVWALRYKKEAHRALSRWLEYLLLCTTNYDAST